VRPGLPLETFCEDLLRLGVNLAKRMTVRETEAFALLRKHLFALHAALGSSAPLSRSNACK